MNWTPEELERLRRLLQEGLWAALATVRGETPLASYVAVAPEPAGGMLLHLSALAEHTRNLAAHPRIGLAWTEADRGGDPQQLARLSLQGPVRPLAREDDNYVAARAHYLARFPDAEVTFALGDFTLYRFLPEGGRYVPGLGRAGRIGPEALRAALAV